MPLPPPDDDPVEAARRRLYRPEASAADVARYRAVDRTRSPSSAQAGRSGGLPARSRAARTAVLLLAGAAVIAVAVGGLLLTGRTQPQPQRSEPDRQGPVTRSLTVSASVRAGFVADLRRDRGARLAAHFLAHPQSRPPELTTLTRAATEEHHGTGDAAVALEPSALADRGGRVTVIVTADRAGPVAWQAVRPAGGTAVTTAARRLELLPGLPASVTTPYAAAAPVRLLLAAPRGVRWDALVVFSN